MPLKSPRFSGDPILERCLSGQHRMLLNEKGLAVKRIQEALETLGFSVGPHGQDGIFGSNTGSAVSAYKVSRNLSPSDPIVGPGTMAALDNDLFFDPPELDPAFGFFSAAVATHRLEPFVALELAAFIAAPVGSWRQMLGLFALANLNSGRILGIVAKSRNKDLRDRYLSAAAPQQPVGLDAVSWFDYQTIHDQSLGRTVPFKNHVGTMRCVILIDDDTILGKGVFQKQATGTTIPVTLTEVLAHELTHARNIDNQQHINATLDTDAGTYIDPALARVLTAAGAKFPRRTVDTLRSFVEEICARHVHWVVRLEQMGKSGAIAQLTGDQLGSAALHYFKLLPHVLDSNGYMAAINVQGATPRFRQLELWLKRCQTYSFSDNANDEARTRQLFGQAAARCAEHATDPFAPKFPDASGLFPLLSDFKQ